jgi:crotonobetainyl-CoA:carnitine CoA-transferase CaiB-like acyl-CoA transferase
LKFCSAEIQEILKKAGVPFAPLRRPDQLLDDEHLLASNQLVPTPIPGYDSVKLPKLPFASSSYTTGVRLGAPGRGEQSREILLELGYSDEEVDALVTEGAVLVGGTLAEEWDSVTDRQ